MHEEMVVDLVEKAQRMRQLRERAEIWAEQECPHVVWLRRQDLVQGRGVIRCTKLGILFYDDFGFRVELFYELLEAVRARTSAGIVGRHDGIAHIGFLRQARGERARLHVGTGSYLENIWEIGRTHV